jgi:hypothetical protein
MHSRLITNLLEDYFTEDIAEQEEQLPYNHNVQRMFRKWKKFKQRK